jgi:hypothetical protein
MKSTKRIYVISFVCVLMFLWTSGCVGLRMPGYGHIDPNRDVTQAFENYEVKPDLNYYISGRDIFPSAIIGIDKRYTLATQMWKKREFTTETLKSLVLNMQIKAMDLDFIFVYGFNMLDESGKDIGDWYSIHRATTSVKSIEDNQFSIPPPSYDIYEETHGWVFRKRLIP